jgi:hypothetical protein
VLGASVPYFLALCLYLLAGTSILSAPAAAAFMGYGISTIPAADLMTKIALAGTALFAAGLMTAAGLGLWSAAKGITRVTLRLLRRGLKLNRPLDQQAEAIPPRKGMLKTAFIICGAAALIGIGATIPSGLGMKLFSIWNSMKPAALELREWSYPASSIRDIEVSTMNCSIVLSTSADPKAEIRVSYEEPEWQTGAPVIEGRKLSFRETSSGTIPFMDFIARHPGTTVLTITVPRGYSARSIVLDSGSGNVSFSQSAEAIAIKTASGNIGFQTAKTPYRLKASTQDGRIVVRGKTLGKKTYEAGASGAAVELETADGTIDIE